MAKAPTSPRRAGTWASASANYPPTRSSQRRRRVPGRGGALVAADDAGLDADDNREY